MVALENKLKDDTVNLVEELREAKIDLKIVSGDSPLTTIHCGKECSILSKEGNILLIDCKEQLVLHNIQGMNVHQLDWDSPFEEESASNSFEKV